MPARPPRLRPDDPALAAPDYPHGEQRGYDRGCSCDRCRAANAARVRTRSGPTCRSTDPGPAAAHVRWLLDTVPGAYREQVCLAARMARPTLAAVLDGKPVERRTAQRLLALTPADVAAHLRNVDPAEVFEHVAWLLTCEGGSVTAIADASGLEKDVVRACARRTRTLLRADSARLILDVTPERMRRCAAHVPPRRAIQRVRSLMANGWRGRDMHPYLRYGNASTGLPFLSRPHRNISQDLDRRIEAMYAALGDKPGPSPRTAARMRVRGWHPPICYDDDGHLIPGIARTEYAAKLSQQAEAAAGRYRRRLRAAALIATGWTNAEIAATVRVDTKTIERIKSAEGDYGLNWVHAPDRGALLAAIDEATTGIVVDEGTDVLDATGIDYKARWKTLETHAQALVGCEYVDATQHAAAA